MGVLGGCWEPWEDNRWDGLAADHLGVFCFDVCLSLESDIGAWELIIG